MERITTKKRKEKKGKPYESLSPNLLRGDESHD